MSEPSLVPLNPKDNSPYGYIPTKWITILFVALYSSITAIHTFQAIRHRIWWLLFTFVFCAIGEIIGSGGRLWSSTQSLPLTMDPFLMQICCTIIAPTFMTAGMFFVFGRIINMVGPEYSRLTPKVYAYVFVGADVVALVVQSVGGAQASSANTGAQSNQGAKVMVGGIIIQMAAITLYIAVQAEYLWRVFKNRPIRPVSTGAVTPSAEKDGALGQSESPSVISVIGKERITRNIAAMLIGMGIAAVFIYIRSIYRTIELLDGWNGPIIENETLFNVLDGTMIFLALVTLSIFHPGRLLWNTAPVRQSNV